jgi:hypothetical protein
MAFLKYPTESKSRSDSPFLQKPRRDAASDWEHVVRFLRPKPLHYNQHILKIDGVDGVRFVYCLGTPEASLRDGGRYELDRSGVEVCRLILVQGKPLHDLDGGGRTDANFALWHHEARRPYILSCEATGSLYRALAQLERAEGPLTQCDVRLFTESTGGTYFRYRAEVAGQRCRLDRDEVSTAWESTCKERFNPFRGLTEIVEDVDEWLSKAGITNGVSLADPACT